MIRMDLSTKQVFLAGFLTWVITFGGSWVNNARVQENYGARILILEKDADRQKEINSQLYQADSQLSKDVASSTLLIQTLNESVKELNRTTKELSAVAARLDERSKKSDREGE